MRYTNKCTYLNSSVRFCIGVITTWIEIQMISYITEGSLGASLNQYSPNRTTAILTYAIMDWLACFCTSCTWRYTVWYSFLCGLSGCTLTSMRFISSLARVFSFPSPGSSSFSEHTSVYQASLRDGHLGCFHFGTLRNNAIVTVFVHVFWWT